MYMPRVDVKDKDPFANTDCVPKKKVSFLARIYRVFVRSLGFSAARDISIWMDFTGKM